MMATGGVIAAQSWDCRSYDIPSYTDHIMHERTEALSSSFDVAFISLSVHTSSSSTTEDHIITAHSSGQLRVYRVKDTMLQWVNRKASGSASLSWDAHSGPVYTLSCLGTGPEGLLISGGDDGWVKAWRIADIEAALAQAAPAPAPGHNSASPSPALHPVWCSQLPRIDCMWGSTGLRPGVVSAAIDRQSDPSGASRLCIGASDGGVHIYELGASTSAPPASTSGKGALPARPLRSLSGHAAGVLSMDVSCMGQLASGSEDGTVRLWDCRQAHACTSAINPWDGVTLPLNSPAQLLQCVKGPYVSTVKFAQEGGWLLMGTGNRALTLWSISLGALAKQQSTPMVPQAAAFVPGEILVAGSSPSLLRFRFSALDSEPNSHPLRTRSIFGMTVHPTSGTIALCGTGGVDLLSPHGAQLGAVWHTPLDD